MGMYILTREQQERKRIAETDLYDILSASAGAVSAGYVMMRQRHRSLSPTQ